MKDILVDATVAKNFCHPVDPHYQEFIQWLVGVGTLVVTQGLVNEYNRAMGGSASATAMPAIVNHLLRQGRLVKFGKTTLRGYRFSARLGRQLLCNKADRDNLKAVLLSARKMALSHDVHFRRDIARFKREGARAEVRPQDLAYQ